MLKITIPERDYWDYEKEQFISVKHTELQLEHSLVSISKWESRWHKPFLGRREKNMEETIDYIRCMTLTQNVNPQVYSYISNDVMEQIFSYMEDPMTATWISRKDKGSPVHEVITAEIIYYWMICAGIPFECQKWHLNRLLMLIRVCNAKNGPARKLGKKELAMRNTALNAARRKKYNSKG